jgi:hypothetical protein
VNTKLGSSGLKKRSGHIGNAGWPQGLKNFSILTVLCHGLKCHDLNYGGDFIKIMISLSQVGQMFIRHK